MKRFNTALILASVASSALLCSYAQAQTVQTVPVTVNNDGETALHATGATSIQNLLVQELNCLGGFNPRGNIGNTSTDGTTTVVSEPTNLYTSFNCATTDLFTGFSGKYVGSGSGAGRSAWSLPGRVIKGDTSGATPITTAFTYFAGQQNPNPFGDWNIVQFAFGDSTLTAGDINSYTTTSTFTLANSDGTTIKTGATGLDIGGAPIMFPKYVLPVAIAYSPAYGVNTANSKTYNFNIQFPQSILGTTAGGLRMSKDTYCKVFNGVITNFNDAAFTAENNGVPLADTQDLADNANRWTAEGVPVRLVGRLDRSGTTDIFTRALAEQCDGIAGVTNKFFKNAETLPYNRSESSATLPTFAAQRSDTGLQPGSTQPEAGTGGAGGVQSITSVGAEYYFFDTVNQANVIATPTANVGKPSAQPLGKDGSGRFLVADGSGNVARAILMPADYTWLSSAYPTVKLNGKIGYIGADFIDGSPSASAGLKAAALQNAFTGLWVMPSAANATTAFGTILPPQTDSITGALSDSTPDARQVRIPTYLQVGGVATGNATRNNPLAWYDVLYSNTTLANPTAGYPITGTTQFFGYTCYKSNGTVANDTAMVNFLNFSTDYVPTFDGNGTTRTGIFTRTAALFNSAGLFTRSNIGALPDIWKHAIRETFLVNSNEASSVAPGGKLGGYNLFIAGTSGAGSTSANSACSGKAGI